jgi:hypothetical protein
MKLKGGINAMMIAIICECQGVKSPLSSAITIVNSVREVRINEEFGETIPVEFKKNALDEIEATDALLSKNTTISIHDEKGSLITDVEADEIKLVVLEEKSALALRTMNKTSTS